MTQQLFLLWIEFESNLNRTYDVEVDSSGTIAMMLTLMLTLIM